MTLPLFLLVFLFHGIWVISSQSFHRSRKCWAHNIPHEHHLQELYKVISIGTVQFSSVQSLFSTPWIAARASLSITISQSSIRLTSIESVMPSSHLILCRPLLLLPLVPRSIRAYTVVFSLSSKFLFAALQWFSQRFLFSAKMISRLSIETDKAP